jgi:branched-chain amino acid transport system permease protein
MRQQTLILLVIWAFFLLLPSMAVAAGEGFYITLFTRLMIFALAASSLNLVLGYGGMVSFGHAAFIGVGGYVIGILAANGVHSAWITWPLALIVCALFALVIGAISLRTRGVYFIMITLAFAQMLYFLFISLKTYGGNDGLILPRSEIGFGVNLDNNSTLYYVALFLLAATLFFLYRLVNSRFGHVIQAVKENETRMGAIGFPVYYYQLACFVIGGVLAGLAGILNANLNEFISPNSLAWTLSGQLMVMVILGGVGRFWGGMIGAFVFLLLETLLGDITIHWQLGVGIVLLVIVLFAPEGIAGLLVRRRTT